MSCTSIRDLIGCKFKVHGRTKEEGFDCYGLAIEILKRNNIYLPDVFYENLITSEKTYLEVINSVKLTKLDKPQELCIILISVNNRPVHVGIYLKNNMFIHATENAGVVIEPLNRWKPRILGYYKVNN